MKTRARRGGEREECGDSYLQYNIDDNDMSSLLLVLRQRERQRGGQRQS